MALSISHVHYDNISLSTAIAKNIIASNTINSNLKESSADENLENKKDLNITNNSNQYYIYIIVFLMSGLFYFLLDKYALIQI